MTKVIAELNVVPLNALDGGLFHLLETQNML